MMHSYKRYYLGLLLAYCCTAMAVAQTPNTCEGLVKIEELGGAIYEYKGTEHFIEYYNSSFVDEIEDSLLQQKITCLAQLEQVPFRTKACPFLDYFLTLKQHKLTSDSLISTVIETKSPKWRATDFVSSNYFYANDNTYLHFKAKGLDIRAVRDSIAYKHQTLLIYDHAILLRHQQTYQVIWLSDPFRTAGVDKLRWTSVNVLGLCDKLLVMTILNGISGYPPVYIFIDLQKYKAYLGGDRIRSLSIQQHQILLNNRPFKLADFRKQQ